MESLQEVLSCSSSSSLRNNMESLQEVLSCSSSSSLRNNMESLTGSPQLLLLLVSEEQHGVPDRKSSAVPPPRL
ncbi:Immunoglobulin kappa variable 2-29 [Dissostichus eleginoides]|nr:Immunoglobulin kappa variable 2-29 [Dissostichus eleginoides]